MLAFPCPKCQAALKAPEEKAGARTKCPRCRFPVQVPQPPISITARSEMPVPPLPLPVPAGQSGQASAIDAILQTIPKDLLSETGPWSSLDVSLVNDHLKKTAKGQKIKLLIKVKDLAKGSDFGKGEDVAVVTWEGPLGEFGVPTYH